MLQNMKTVTLALMMSFYPYLAAAADVTLRWDPHPDPDLHHFTLYQADQFEAHTGPWVKVKEIPADQTTTTITVEDDKNFAWYLSATGTVKGESGPSNAVMLYERKRMDDPTCLGFP